MATLLIIASLALNIALTAILCIIRNNRSSKQVSANCSDSKRNIEGRLMLSEKEISRESLALISNVKLSRTVGIMPQIITDKVVSCVVAAIKEELESKPQFINIQVARDYNFKRIVVDFDFDLIMKSCARIQTDLSKPRIINTHY